MAAWLTVGIGVVVIAACRIFAGPGAMLLAIGAFAVITALILMPISNARH